jgi:hypothetical protein
MDPNTTFYWSLSRTIDDWRGLSVKRPYLLFGSEHLVWCVQETISMKMRKNRKAEKEIDLKRDRFERIRNMFYSIENSDIK